MNNKSQAVTTRIAYWQDDKDDLSAVRRQVFINEQHVPEEMEWDDYDQVSTHYLSSIGQSVVAVARLKPDGQLGRMAVLENYRNQGIGSELVHFILQDLNSKKIKNIYLHAQTTAVPFYKKLGFIEDGEVFYEANIPHLKMFLEL